MAECGVCGSENPSANRFCRDCGTPLTLTCPSCRAAVDPGHPFCGACGFALTGGGETAKDGVAAGPAEDAEPLAGTHVAERRVCSVLFADLVGFTPLSETRDPEEVRELLSAYFDRARTVIGRYGGVVEKFIGDAVMAIWGTPVATEGDAERAVRAALDVIAAVAELGDELGAPDLEARAGVVTGEVAVTVGQGGEGVAGDAVNTAARIQSVAAPGAVWVDAATYRLAGASIGFADTGEHKLKGKSEPMHLWAATRVLSGVGGSQRTDGLEARLLGRDAELRTVKELFHASAERRVPRLVVVSGPAGVGKSRLGWEFEKYIDGLADTMYWHRGRCLSYGEGVVFWALTEIVRQRLGIAEEDPAETAATRLTEGLVAIVPDPVERAYVGPRLGRLLGVSLPGDAGGALASEELFAGWRVFFERLAETQPVLLLIEDAQYADAGLLDFMDHLVDWARDSPIFVVVFTRPELDSTRPGFGSGRNRSSLTLDPLDEASMAALIDALVPEIPEAARAAILSQAEGIPLFAVETVRSLVDRDIVVPRDGVYRLVGDLGELTVPDGLRALLAARLDALDSKLRSLVSEAAVLGTTFPADSLVAVSAQDEQSVRAGLAELLRREVLSISADRLSPQRGDYRFSQDLLRQVAYDTMSRRDRKTRHLTVAAHLRSVFRTDGDEVAEVISRHYLDAIAAVPDAPDVPEIRAQAITMLVRAGDRALRAGAGWSAASNYANAARQTELSGVGSDDDVVLSAAGLWERAARAALIAFDVDGTLSHSKRASGLYAAQGQTRAAARAEAIAGDALRRSGRHGEARETLTAALVVLRPDPDSDTVTALDHLAAVEIFSGAPDGDGLSAEALALGQALDVDAGLLADLFTDRGIAVGFANRSAEAVAHLRHAAGLAEEVGDTVRQARALLNLAEMLNGTDPVAAAEAARKSAALARHSGSIDFFNYAVCNEVEALLLVGEWDDAHRVLHETINTDQLGDLGIRGIIASLMAVLRGDLVDAAAYAELPGLRGSEDPQDQSGTALCDAFLAASQSRYADSLDYARAVFAHVPTLGIRFTFIRWAWPLATRSAHNLGATDIVIELVALLDAHPAGHLPPLLRAERVLAQARIADANDDPDANMAFDRAVASLRQAASPYHLAHGLLDHAEHFTRLDNRAGALALVTEARTIAGQLRAKPLLDRADRVAGFAESPERADAQPRVRS
jgi:class 3 adenylate cyclase/tetratricopeptide (TPR) repeat protein